MKKIGLRHRLEEALERYGLKEGDVAELLGNENLRSYRSSKYSNKGLTSAQMEEVLSKYPDININWVLTGKGEPLTPANRLTKSQLDTLLKESMVEEEAMPYGNGQKSPDKIQKIQSTIDDIYLIVKDIQTRLV